MKDNRKPITARPILKRAVRSFGEKALATFFAALSLTFALYYGFAHNSARAGSSVVASASSVRASEKNDSTNSLFETASVASPASVSNVVSKALAFKSLLSDAQRTTLEKTYTTTLARKWSNLPCGASCRNGIQFSTLTAEQLSAALEVIQAAMGTAADEGYDEFQQIRAADAYLGANGGGSGYSSGIYFIAFLNTPSTNGAWMLQFGGHHYAANIAYNNGHVVGVTPEFRGVEPTTFTVNGTTYSPLTQERTALQNMLAALTTTQLSAAKLSSTYSDVTMSPGESNGGNGTFPATKVGLQVGTLTTEQKQLVLDAMKPWVQDMDSGVASVLLSIYQNQLDGTYIAYTGNGTSGNAGSFLTANTNYVRIDGPTVWIEFICQNGVVFNQIHYHTVWRDHVRDYGADLSLTTPLENSPTAASVSITGRVLTPEGKGLRNAVVIMTGADGEPRRAQTNAFGYYRFADVSAGETYVVEVSSKRYSFVARVINLNEELIDLNFVANQ